MTTSFQNKDGPVVLVSRPIAFTFPLSYAYLAGYLIQHGEEVKVIFRHPDLPALVQRIMELEPVLVGFGSLYPELREIRELIGLLDQAGRRFPIVIGGQMVSPTPEFAVSLTGADFAVVGEGEIILHQLVIALREGRDPSGIGGLAIRHGNQVTLTGVGPFIEDLSLLPPVPYDLFPETEWLAIGRWYDRNCPQPHWRLEDRVINIHGGRGCPFSCNFCYHHSAPRYRPIDLMLAEAKEALERFDGNMLYFSDDLVLATPQRARALVDGLRKLGRPIEYSVSARFDILNRLDDALLAEMKETGCRIMGLGIESGSDRMLKVIGKNCTSAQVLHNLRRLKQVGILPTVSIMVGQFDETVDDVEASVRLMVESVRDNPNIQYAFTVTTPFPGSRLYEHIMKNGLLSDDEDFYARYSSGHSDWNMVVNLSRMSDEEVWGARERLTSLYLEEQRKLTGRSIKVISLARRLWRRVGQLVEGKGEPGTPGNGRAARGRTLCGRARDGVSSSLEWCELRLRGLN
jgi:anaerobic magnesium-protoporphyrin IX monomethyl ester cyclase